MAVFDDGVGQAIHDVVPPFGFAGGVLERDVVARKCCCQVDVGGDTDDAVGDAVGRHHDAVHIGKLGDPLELSDASNIEGVRTDYSNGFGFDEVFEVLSKVDLLARVDRCGGLHLNLAE